MCQESISAKFDNFDLQQKSCSSLAAVLQQFQQSCSSFKSLAVILTLGHGPDVISVLFVLADHTVIS